MPHQRTVEEVAIEKVLQKHNSDIPLNAYDFVVLISSFSALAVTAFNYLRSLKIQDCSLIQYISFRDAQQIQPIENILSRILGATGCDRVVVGMLHGGEVKSGTRHFEEMSLIYEARRQEIASLKERVKRVPIGKIQHEINYNSNKAFTKYSAADKDLSQGCRDYMASVGLAVTYSRSLTNSQDDVFAILELHSIHEGVDEIDQETLLEIEPIVGFLNHALSYVRKNKKIPL